MNLHLDTAVLARPATRRAVMLGAAALTLAPALRMTPAAAQETPSPAPGACLPTPQMTAGPFWLPDMPVRRDITEGLPGRAFRLELRALAADGCRPLAGAAIDLWHCDAAGVYSGVQGAAGTWMRGIQVTDAEGIAVFDTVFPGWYPGRTPHLHLLIRAGAVAQGATMAGGEPVFVGQLYFDDAQTDLVYAQPPYDARDNAARTSNTDDGIFMREPERDRLIVPLGDATEATPAPGGGLAGTFALVIGS